MAGKNLRREKMKIYVENETDARFVSYPCFDNTTIFDEAQEELLKNISEIFPHMWTREVQLAMSHLIEDALGIVNEIVSLALHCSAVSPETLREIVEISLKREVLTKISAALADAEGD
jgi:hypothetical protein